MLMRSKPTRRLTVRHSGAGSVVRQPRPAAGASVPAVPAGAAAGGRLALLDRLGPGVMESLESRVYMSVSRDANGFTVVTPAADARVVYVSSAGNDGLDGQSAGTAVRTIARARALVGASAGQVGTRPDQILFRRGDSFAGRFDRWGVSGRSADDPFVIGAYTDPARPSTDRPKILTGVDTGFSNNTQAGTVSNVYILGVAFEADLRDYREKPAGFTTGFKTDNLGGTYGVNVFGSVNNLHVEDASFQYYRGGIVAQEAGGYARPANITVRRSQLVDNYAPSFSSSGAYVTSEGIFAQRVDGLALLENVFDHNGWSDPAFGNFGAVATIYNHNAYIHVSVDDFSAVGNIFSNAASHGLQARAGGVVRNNLFVNNPIAMSFGYVNGVERAGGVSGEISGNVVHGGRDINGALRGWGIELGNLKPAASGGGTVVRNNVFTSYAAQGQPAIQVSFGTNVEAPQNGAGINDLTVERNIVYGWTRGLWINPGLVPGGTNRYGLNNLSVRNNEFQQVSTTPVVDHGPSYSSSAERWSGNRYDLVNAGSESANFFRVKGSSYSLAQWQGQVEPNASTARLSYPNPNVSPASYNASIGGANSPAAYVEQARGQSSRTWRTAYTSAAVLNYMFAGFAGQRVDNLPPAAQLSVAPVTAGGGATHSLVVNWVDDNQVNPASVGNGDVTVTGPGGYSQAAALVSAVRSADGSMVTATYTVPAPGGRWAASANGQYAVSVAAGQVTDTKGNATPGGPLGSFAVSIAAAAPTASMPALGRVTVPTAGVALPVTYSVGQGLISRGTIDSLDLVVTGPNGYTATPRLVGAGPAANAATIVADYVVDPPDGGWRSDGNGLYTVAVRSGAVATTAGAAIGQAVLGTFAVDVTVPTAVGSGPTITVPTTAAQTVTVAYAAAGGIDPATLDSADVRVEGPNGFVAATTFLSRTGGGVPGNPMVAVYRFAPPAGGFDPARDGTYTIRLQPDQVRAAVGGAPAPGGPVGTFVVAIDDEPPTATSTTPDEFRVSPGTTTKTITVVFRDPVGVDRTTVGPGDVVVERPDGSQAVPTFTGASGSATEVTATYELSMPGGITREVAGGYTIFVADRGVADVAGNFTYEGQYAGEFRLAFDDIAPTASAAAFGDGTLKLAGESAEIDVRFSDGTPGLDERSLSAATFRAVGPNGFDQPLTRLSIDPAEPGHASGSYRLEAPPGGWTFDDNGTYQIVLDGGKLADVAGNVAARQVVGTFRVLLATPFVASVDPVAVIPGLDAVTFRFVSDPVGLDVGDLSLTRDNGPNLLPGSPAALTLLGDLRSARLSGLSSLTRAAGQYVLRLPAASGVTDGSGQPLARDMTFTFRIGGSADTTPPTATVAAVAPSPRSAPVGSGTVAFSEPVTGFDVADVVLTRDGRAVSLAGVNVASTDGGRTFTVGGLTAATTPTGAYTLAVRGSGTGVIDAAGNPLAGGRPPSSLSSRSSRCRRHRGSRRSR
jgi:hypothetical protein